MILKYSETADALYIYLQPGVSPTRGEEIDNATIVDLDDNGAVVGIEVLSPARDWPLDEIAERFSLDMADHLLLRALVERVGSRPFAYLPQRQTRRVAASTASR